MVAADASAAAAAATTTTAAASGRARRGHGGRSTSKIRRIGKQKGATLRDVNAWRWIKVAARHFKQEGKLFVPSCTELVKTSTGRERAPQNPDWYYVRCAAVLRAIYLRPGVGYGGLSKRFASKKNNGSRPEHTVRAAKGLLHWACKSLTKLGLVESGVNAGQRLTRKGRKFADSLAFQVRMRRFNKDDKQAQQQQQQPQQ